MTTDALHLRRIDPARNMARFYGLALQPTLFGDVSLLRNWGRIGTRGQAKVETFASEAEAETALLRILRAKRRRGYAAPDESGDGGDEASRGRRAEAPSPEPVR